MPRISSADSGFQPYQIILPLTLFGMVALHMYIGYMASIPFFVGYLIWFFRSNIESNFVFLLAVQPFSGLFKAGAGLPSFAVVFYLVLIAKALFGMRGLAANHPVLYPLVAAFSVLAAAQLIDVIVVGASLNKVFAFLVNVALCVASILALDSEDGHSLKQMRSAVAMCFPLSVAAMVLAANVYPSLAVDIASRISTFQTAGVVYDRFSGLVGDANFFSQLVLCAVALSLGDLLVTKQKCYKVMDVLVTVFLVAQGLRSYSKSFSITLALIAVVFCVVLGKRSFGSSKQKAVLFIVGIPLLTAILLAVIFEVALPGFMLRMGSGQDLTTGRAAIWNAYLSKWLSNVGYMAFGFGFDNGRYASGLGDAAHNAYIELLTELGIVGLACLVFIVKPSLKNIKGVCSDPRLLYMLPLAITCFGLALSDYDFVYVCISILPCFQNRCGQRTQTICRGEMGRERQIKYRRASFDATR
ncbi:O-antigen ligase family protein [Collinsella sp. HCP3S3_D1]|uniref:O-antigen ligase family protein n=1 Tax=Collinsella sp. HCP3S3_D1 TaxID=3438934 RepID=UPI003F8B43F5